MRISVTWKPFQQPADEDEDDEEEEDPNKKKKMPAALQSMFSRQTSSKVEPGNKVKVLQKN